MCRAMLEERPSRAVAARRHGGTPTSHLPFIFMNPGNLDTGGLFQLAVDEQPILCAFTLSELERLVDWGSWKQRERALEPEDGELLERIKRLAVAAAERPSRASGEGSRSSVSYLPADRSERGRQGPI